MASTRLLVNQTASSKQHQDGSSLVHHKQYKKKSAKSGIFWLLNLRKDQEVNEQHSKLINDEMKLLIFSLFIISTSFGCILSLRHENIVCSILTRSAVKIFI
jgi:hypothetical protein